MAIKFAEMATYYPKRRSTIHYGKLSYMPENDPVLHPIAIAQVMVNFAANQSVDVETCLQGTDIAEESLHDSETLVTRGQEMRLIENLILALPDVPALGFELGLQYNISTFGIWGFALRTSRTIREATERSLRYLPLSTAYCRVYQFEDASNFGIGMDPEPIPPHIRQFLLERDLATCLNLVRELKLANLNVAAIEFRGEPPEYAKQIENLCGLKPEYNQSHNALMVHLSDADKPLPTFDANLVQILDEQCQSQLERRQTTGLAEQVRKQLLGPLGLVASLDDVAKSLALSPRSLRRKLDQEGSSFRSIVEEERRQIALQLLACSNMLLDDLAVYLGYNDTASFTRAFRRWMACSPGQYRRNAQK